MADTQTSESALKKKGKSHASKLAAIVVASKGELFHTSLREPFVTIDHITMPLNSPDFVFWLARAFVQATKSMPSAKSLKEAINGLIGSALFTGCERPVFVRVAAVADAVFIDLGHAIVRITGDGWSLHPHVDEVRFVRPKGFLPLPEPVRGTRTLPELLAGVVNVQAAEGLKLITAWLVAAARGRKPYPILNIVGEQGSAKSSTCRSLRRAIDPSVADVRVTPREMRDLMIAARNTHVVSFDNLTRLDEWFVNGLCGLATGAGSATRELTTDVSEIIINAARPILLNGINDVVRRPDLLDRTVVVTLEPIPDDRRLTETETDERFAAVLPEILAALFDAVACALRHEPHTRPARLPRMADFARTIVAASEALGWGPEEFLDAYSGNRQSATEALLEGNVIVVALREFMSTQAEWSGTAEALRKVLTKNAEDDDKRWPKTASTLAGRLRELAPGLRSTGIEIDFVREHGGRLITLKCSSAQAGGPTEPAQMAFVPEPENVPF